MSATLRSLVLHAAQIDRAIEGGSNVLDGRQQFEKRRKQVMLAKAYRQPAKGDGRA
jgi:phytoene/squalene synthetase